MNEFLIKNYIQRLTLEDINNFAKKHGIDLNEDELKLIEQHIRKDWHTIIYGNTRPILDNLKNKLKNNE